MKELEYYLEQVKLHGRLIGAISAIYDIPLAEIHELEKRIKEDKKIEQMIEANEKKAAKRKFDKLIPRLEVVGGTKR